MMMVTQEKKNTKKMAITKLFLLSSVCLSLTFGSGVSSSKAVPSAEPLSSPSMSVNEVSHDILSLVVGAPPSLSLLFLPTQRESAREQ